MLFPAFAAADEARMIAFSGNVEIRNAREGQWAPALMNTQIPEGGAIRTGSDGSAVVQLPNKARVWVKESSSLELEQRRTFASRLALVFGKIKVRVPHLMRRERFEVGTPSAVCAVRGTEFTVTTNETGAMDINVIYGEVKLNFVVPPEKGAAQLFIAQGRNMSLEEKGKPAKVAMMTADQEKSSLENWNPGLSPAERGKELKVKENDRAQIREFARVTNGTENSVKSFLNIVKESDIEAGRTLKDIHGNVVRVAQFLMRPHADEIQFVNLVKRPSYNAESNRSRYGAFNYNGGAVGNRLDYLQMIMNFNKDLPQSIDEWPGFFKGSAVKPDWASFVTANKTKAEEIFFIAQLYKYEAARDELINNSEAIGIAMNDAANNGGDRHVLITGVIKNDSGSGLSASDGLRRISRQGQVVADTTNADGTLKYAADNTDVGGTGGSVLWAMNMVPDNTNTAATLGPNGAHDTSYKKKSDPNISNFTADAYLVGNNPTLGDPANVFWFTTEAYVINNEGSLQNGDSLVNSSQDSFSLMKNVAGESIMSIKKSLNGYAGRTGWYDNKAVYADIKQDDYFAYGNYGGRGTNIDVVFIPDLLMAAVQRMLPAITKLSN